MTDTAPFQLTSALRPDGELVLSEVDQEFAACRARLVRRRFFADLKTALEAHPEVMSITLHAGSLSQFVQVEDVLYSGEVIGKNSTTQSEKMANLFYASLGKARKAIGSSNSTLEALYECLPLDCADEEGLSIEAYADVYLLRQEAIMLCEAIAENDTLVFTREVRHELALRRAVKAAENLPKARI